MALRKAGKSAEQIQKDRERIAKAKLDKANRTFNKVEQYELKKETPPKGICEDFRKAAVLFATGVQVYKNQAYAILWSKLDMIYGYEKTKQIIISRLASVANTHFKQHREVPHFVPKKVKFVPNQIGLRF